MNYCEDDEAWQRIAQNMVSYGGGFARAIGDAMFRADSGNRRRLEQAFRDLMDKYHPDNWK